MKALKLLFQNLSRIMSQPAFYICIAACTVILLASPFYYNAKYEAFESIFYVITQLDKETIGTFTAYSFEAALKAGVMSYLSLFAPIIAAAPFTAMISASQKRFSLFRMSKNTYFSSTFLSAIISGGLVMLFGFILFSIICGIGLPNISQYPAETVLNTYESFTNGCIISIPGNITLSVYFTEMLKYFIYGVTISALPCFFCAVTRNCYISLCIPFFIKYTADRLLFLLIDFAVISDNPDLLYSLHDILSPDLPLLITSQMSLVGWGILYRMVMLALPFLAYVIILRKKADCGE